MKKIIILMSIFIISSSCLAQSRGLWTNSETDQVCLGNIEEEYHCIDSDRFISSDQFDEFCHGNIEEDYYCEDEYGHELYFDDDITPFKKVNL